MFHIDVINPQVDIDLDRISFDPNDPSFQQYEQQIKQREAPPVSEEELLIQQLGFDPSNIISSAPIYARKQVYYQAHAATTYSVEQATNIIDYLGRVCDSDDCMPFAMKLIEDGQLMAVSEDNGEFACGRVLENCLKRVEGFNVLVCVSRKVTGCYVTDIVQGQKLHIVKEAADQALELLYKKLTGQEMTLEMEEAQTFDATQIDLSLQSRMPSRFRSKAGTPASLQASMASTPRSAGMSGGGLVVNSRPASKSHK